MPMYNAMPSRGADLQPYKYNGKELDRMHGLNTYDYGARQHDPILAKKFEESVVKAAKADGGAVATQTRLVPMNGKGNAKGNRTNVDGLKKIRMEPLPL